ncbi:pullulanase X25 domain-containing protein [Tessaracoccus coleopterorum]|uniref:pullulanase X25 domain-containing protein n=1 Tax=Tessaracoccus coleopterorum TaxID=2714950 RepID=UPI002F91416A
MTFYYDPVSHAFFNTAQGPVVTLAGSFQAAVGCPGDWQPDCLRTLMFDADGDGVLTWSSSAIPAGAYEVKVAHGRSWDENYGVGGVPGGSNYGFTVAAGKLVTFRYTLSDHTLEIVVEDPPLAGTGEFLGHWVDATTVAWPSALITDGDDTTWELWSDPDGGLALEEGPSWAGRRRRGQARRPQPRPGRPHRRPGGGPTPPHRLRGAPAHRRRRGHP